MNNFYFLQALFASVLIFILDLQLPLGIAAGVLYVLPILLMHMEKDSRKIYTVVALSIFLIIIGIYFSPPSDEAWKAYVNRLISIAVILASAYAVIHFRLNDEQIASTSRRKKILLALMTLLTVLFFIWVFGTVKKIETTVIDDTLGQMNDITEASHDTVKDVWLKNLFLNTGNQIKNPSFIRNVTALRTLKNHRQALLDSPAQADLRNLFKDYLKSNELIGIFVISKDGTSLASMRDTNVGTKNFIAAMFPERLAKTFAGEEQVIPIIASDVPLPDKNGIMVPDHATMFLMFPVFDPRGEVIAAFTVRIDPDLKLKSIMNMHHFGTSGVSYVFNRDGTVFTVGSSTVGLDRKDSLETILRSIDTVRSGTESHAIGIRGKRVLRTWIWDESLGIGFASEMLEEDALKRFHRMQIYILGSIFGVMGISFGLIILVSIYRRQLYKKLEYSENFLRSVLDNAGDAILTYDSSGRVLSANQKAVELTGYEIDELIGMNISTLLPSWNTESFESFLGNFSKPVQGESAARHKNGGDIPVRIGVSKIALNTELYYTMILHDLSDYKAAEAKLNEYNTRLEGIVQERTAQLEEAHKLAKIGHWRWDMEEGGLYWSDEIYRIFGLDRNLVEPNYALFIEYVHEEDRKAIEGEIKRVLDEPESQYFIQHRIVVAGEVRYVEERGYVERNPEGKAYAMVGTVQDITERKLQENALKEAEEISRQILESAGEGIYGLDENGVTVFVNSSAASMLGYAKEELLGIHIHETIHHSYPDHTHYPKEQCPMYSTLQNGVVSHIQNEVLWKKDGTPLPVEYTSTPIYKDGVLKGAVVSFFDRSERKKYEEFLQSAKQQAEAANEAKTSFLANMSHEIRTPMNAVLGYAQLLLRSDEIGEHPKKYLEIIQHSGEHLLELINEVLDMSKIESGEVSLDNDYFNLHGLLQEIEQMFAVRADEKKLRFSITWDEGLVQFIMADEQKLRQILINLIGNALKFTEEGFVTVNVSHSFDDTSDSSVSLMFEIRDSGIGIPEGDRQEIFKPFKQSKAGLNHKGGTGLGLSISRKFANLMGGDIVLQEGSKGTEFLFTMKAEVSSEEKVIKKHSFQTIIGIEEGEGDIKVLVVDDNGVNRMLLRSVLEDIGFVIQEAENGEEAVNLFRTWEPQIVLMDIQMPVMNGIEASEQIRSSDQGKEAVILLISATMMEFDERVIGKYVDAFLRKPIDLDELLMSIGKYAGIRYLYEEKGEEVTVSSEIEENGSHDFAGNLSPEVMEELYTIVKIGNLDKFKKRVESIEELDPASKKVLLDRIEAFDIEGLLKLLKH